MIDLGVNMYKNSASIETQGGAGSAAEQKSASVDKDSDSAAKDELKFLSRLIGGGKGQL